MPKKQAARLRPHATIEALAKSSLVEELHPPALVIYIRLLGMVADGRAVTHPTNAELMMDPRSVLKALRQLADHGLVKIVYAKDRSGREIEVLR